MQQICTPMTLHDQQMREQNMVIGVILGIDPQDLNGAYKTYHGKGTEIVINFESNPLCNIPMSVFLCAKITAHPAQTSDYEESLDNDSFGMKCTKREIHNAFNEIHI